jgi:hypothetical protein
MELAPMLSREAVVGRGVIMPSVVIVMAGD